MTVIGLVTAAVQGALTGPATRKFGEGFIVRASLVASTVGFGLMLLAWDMTSVLLTVGFFVFANAMLRPAIAAALSRKAGSEQGAVMGISNSFMSLGRVAGPLWAGLLFDVNIILPYLTGGFILLLIFGASLIWWKDAPGRGGVTRPAPVVSSMD
jgi:DHA1 family multidrug resistance protein-like MFS transporter